MSFRVYVGRLHEDSSEARLRDVFSRFGQLASIERKKDYAYVFYEKSEEAEAAIAGMNGAELDGNTLLVENSRSNRDVNKPRPVKRFDLRVLVEGLNARISWQDLKDWARQAGDVTFSNVFTREGLHMGVVEFKDEEGLENALSKLPNVPISGTLVKVEKDVNPHQGERRAREDRAGGFGGRDRDRGGRDMGDRGERRGDRDERRDVGRFDDRGRSGPPGPREDYRDYDYRDRGYDRPPPGYHAPPPGYYPPGPPAPRYDDRPGYDRRYSDDYRRDAPPPMGGPGYMRGRSRSRSRSRGRAGPPGYYPPPEPYRGGYDAPPPGRRFEEGRRSEGRFRDARR